MIMQIPALVILEFFLIAPPQILKSKQTLIGLLVTAIKQFLASILGLKWLLQFSYGSEPILQGRILHLLGHFLVGWGCNQFE
jgi:hypothetical protein